MKIDFDPITTERSLISRLKKALYEIMVAIERHAKRFAPYLTGRLRASIHVEPDTPALKMRVTDGVDYGVHQEFGTENMVGTPFMRPAVKVTLKSNLKRIMKKYKLK